MSRRRSFIEGALILTAAGLGVRFMGAGLRIFLAAVMGDEGIGLYQMAYPVYTTLLAVSTAGIPIAVSKLMAENLAIKDYRGGYRVFKTAFIILAVFGTLFSLLLYFGADFFVRYVVKDPRAFYPLISISPAIFLVTIMSAFRGFFQGQQEMAPTALSQIVEQVGRVLVVIVLVYLLLPRGLEFAAAGAAFGAVAGAVFGLAVLLFIFVRRMPAFRRMTKNQVVLRDFSFMEVFIGIITLSIPITLGSLVIPLINLVDLGVVPMRLHEAGFAVEEATALYGQLTGMANSVIQFPIIITIALAMSLVPAISEAQALHNRPLIRGRTDLALRATLFFSLPAALGLFVLARPITFVLFDNVQAAYPLSILAFAVIFLSLYTSTAGILQGLGKVLDPVKNMFLGASVKLALSWFLTAVPVLNIGGAALATVVGFFLASFLNIRKVAVLTQWRFNAVELLLKPTAAALVMAWGVFIFYGFFLQFFAGSISERLAHAASLSVTIVLGVAVYAAVLLLLGGVREEDLRAVPRLGSPLLNAARRLKMIRK